MSSSATGYVGLEEDALLAEVLGVKVPSEVLSEVLEEGSMSELTVTDEQIAKMKPSLMADVDFAYCIAKDDRFALALYWKKFQHSAWHAEMQAELQAAKAEQLKAESKLVDAIEDFDSAASVKASLAVWEASQKVSALLWLESLGMPKPKGIGHFQQFATVKRTLDPVYQDWRLELENDKKRRLLKVSRWAVMTLATRQLSKIIDASAEVDELPTVQALETAGNFFNETKKKVDRWEADIASNELTTAQADTLRKHLATLKKSLTIEDTVA